VAKDGNISGLVAQIVFGPTLLAYGWIFLGYVTAGLTVYIIFSFGAYWVHLFDDIKDWPRVSRVALGCGPPLICVGLYFSTQKLSYWMLIPGGIYMLLSILGGVALMGKR
jgi:cytochrome b subunit of formate dehydrogenase